MKKNLEFISKLLFIMGFLGTFYSFVIGKKMITIYCIGIMVLGFVLIAYFYDIFSIKNMTINGLCSFLIHSSILAIPYSISIALFLIGSGYAIFYSQKLFNPNKELRYSDIFYSNNKNL